MGKLFVKGSKRRVGGQVTSCATLPSPLLVHLSPTTPVLHRQDSRRLWKSSLGPGAHESVCLSKCDKIKVRQRGCRAVATAEAGRPREAPGTTQQEVSGRSVVGDIITAAFPRASRGHAL